MGSLRDLSLKDAVRVSSFSVFNLIYLVRLLDVLEILVFEEASLGEDILINPKLLLLQGLIKQLRVLAGCTSMEKFLLPITFESLTSGSI